MSQFNLADIQSSTLILSTPSLVEMFDVVQSMIRVDPQNALNGLTLIVEATDLDDVDEFEDEEIIVALNDLRANAFAESSY